MSASKRNIDTSISMSEAAMDGAARGHEETRHDIHEAQLLARQAQAIRERDWATVEWTNTELRRIDPTENARNAAQTTAFRTIAGTADHLDHHADTLQVTLYTMAEVAALTRFSLDEINRKCLRGEIRAVRTGRPGSTGGSIRIPHAALVEWQNSLAPRVPSLPVSIARRAKK